jgi:IclR helix-turn-helix domain
MVINIECRQSSAYANLTGMPDAESISITLSPAQVDQILRAAARSTVPSVSVLVAGATRGRALAEGPPTPPASFLGDAGPDRRLSRSLLRGLSILTCFNGNGGERGILELARELGMSASTTHRYAMTLTELGLLERSPRTRKYRLPAPPSA